MINLPKATPNPIDSSSNTSEDSSPKEIMSGVATTSSGDVVASAPTTSSSGPTPTENKRKVALLFDGSYDSAWMINRVARDVKNGVEKDLDLTIVTTPQSVADSKDKAKFDGILAGVKKILPDVKVESLALGGENPNYAKPEVATRVKEILAQTFKKGLQILYVPWSNTIMVPNNATEADTPKYENMRDLVMRVIPSHANEIEDADPENIKADKEKRPRPNIFRVNLFNQAQDFNEMKKDLVNFGLDNAYPELKTKPQAPTV